MDFLLIPGDFAAHKLAEREPGQDPTGKIYEAVKENIAAVFNKLSEHFPDTVILPTFGNNDGRVHDQAIDEADREDYYSFIYKLWFSHPGNSKFNIPSIEETLMASGYYRADVTDKISLLSLNSMYMDYADTSVHANEE